MRFLVIGIKKRMRTGGRATRLYDIRYGKEHEDDDEEQYEKVHPCEAASATLISGIVALSSTFTTRVVDSGWTQKKHEKTNRIEEKEEE